MELGRIGGPRRAAMRYILVVLLSLLSVMQAVAAQNQLTVSDGSSTDDVLRTFQERTLVQVPGKGGAKALVRWETPVRIGFVIDQSAEIDVFSTIANDLVNIRQATGHDISVSTRANFVILMTSDLSRALQQYGAQIIAPFFSDGTDYHAFFAQAQSERWACAGKTLLSDKPAIAAYLLVVINSPEHQSLETDGCVLRGLINGMGAAGHATATQPTTYKLRQSDSRFSELDREVLKLLYDPRIKSGMGTGEATETVKSILGLKH